MTNSVSDSGPKPLLPEAKSDPQQILFSVIMYFSVFLIPVILVLLGWDFYNRFSKPIPFYYAASDENLTRMIPLNQPNLTTNAVLHWATYAAAAALTFNFHNYPQVFQDVRVYFTPKGYDNFLSALKTAHTIENIVKKQLAVYAVLTDNPIILREGPAPGGSYAWQIEFPMLLTYESERENKQHIIITLLIVRVPTSESVTGIGIASFVVAESRVQTQ